MGFTPATGAPRAPSPGKGWDPKRREDMPRRVWDHNSKREKAEER